MSLILEGKERKNKSEAIFEEVMARKFPKYDLAQLFTYLWSLANPKLMGK